MTRWTNRRDDAGLTLVELLVTMMLTGIVVTAVAATFTSSLRTTASVNAKVGQASDVRLALEVMTRRLRVAVPPSNTGPAFASGSANAVRFYAALQAGSTNDPTPTMVEYKIDTTRKCLLETLTTAAGSSAPYTFPPSNATSRCIAFGTITSASKLFTYYDDGASTTPLGNAAGDLATTDLGNVASVKVDLTVMSGTKANGTRAVSRVTLPNVGLIVNGAGS